MDCITLGWDKHGAKAMKCVQHPISGEVKRVSESDARRLVGYAWRYVPKQAYKDWKAKELTQAVRRRV